MCNKHPQSNISSLYTVLGPHLPRVLFTWNIYLFKKSHISKKHFQSLIIFYFTGPITGHESKHYYQAWYRPMVQGGFESGTISTWVRSLNSCVTQMAGYITVLWCRRRFFSQTSVWLCSHFLKGFNTDICHTYAWLRLQANR